MPPIGYPGNSISKEARAKAGGGFESAIEVVAAVSAFSISAPSGISDGNEITLSSSSGQFSAGPDKKVAMGFGVGPIHTLSLGNSVPSHVDPITGQSWTFVGTRSVAEDPDGTRWIAKGGSGGGFYFDPGANLNAGERLFISSIVRASATGVQEGGSTQWKTYRVQQDTSEGAPNSFYLTTFEADSAAYNGGRLIVYRGDSSAVGFYNGSHPTLDGRIVQQMLYAKQGTPDAFDAQLSPECMWPEASTQKVYKQGYDTSSLWFSPTGLAAEGFKSTESLASERWRVQFFQDYVNYASGVVIERKDVWVQTGSQSHSRIADTATPSTETESYVLPEKNRTASGVTLHLWKGLFPDYTNKFIHHYGDDGQFLCSEALS